MKKAVRRFGVPLCALLLMAAGPVGSAHAFTLNGFGDIVYSSTPKDANGESNNGFALGQLDFYAAEQIGDRLDVLAEYVIENPGDGFVVDLERLQIGYAVANNHKIRAGRFHNLLGYWNLAFHHGAQLSTTVARPFFLEFEDENGVIPTHMVGLWWQSRFEPAAGRVDLGIMVGNGAGLNGDGTTASTELDPGSGGDPDNEKAVSANLTFRPAAVKGLEVGLSGQVDKIVVTGTPGGIASSITEIDQTLLGLHAVYETGGLELLAEFYQWQNDVSGSAHDDSIAYYVQAGYLVGEATTPYVRYETLDAKGGDPFFQAVGMTDGTATARTKTITTVGVRHDLNYRSALKAEVRFVDDESAYDGSFEETAVQWTFAF